MTWTTAYRLALHMLPAGLRCKHGRAMEVPFARELARAEARGELQGALAGASGVWDVVRRGAYEHVRPGRGAVGERGGRQPTPTWQVCSSSSGAGEPARLDISMNVAV